MITEDTVQFLSDAEACASYDRNLKFPYNRGEGVLRKVKHSDDICDANGNQRFYHDSNMCVLCGGQEYLIANKRAFYDWLTVQTTAALNKTLSAIFDNVLSPSSPR